MILFLLAFAIFAAGIAFLDVKVSELDERVRRLERSSKWSH